MKPAQISDGTSSEDDEDLPVKSENQLPDPQSQNWKTSSAASLQEEQTMSTQPTQKRRRVTRACDECRRKKIKCDGKQPCTHCVVYSYECTFDQPSNRRRNPAPAYVEALESKLQKAQAILSSLAPGVNLDDPHFDAQSIDQIIASSSFPKSSGHAHGNTSGQTEVQDDDLQLQTIIAAAGALVLDEQGNLDYHGNSSSFAFMQNLRSQFGELSVPDPRIPPSKSPPISHLVESPKSATSSHFEHASPPLSELPDKATAMQLCKITLEVACALMRFVHKPRFYQKAARIFDIEPEDYTNSDLQFLPLLYVVMAVGCLYAQSEGTNPDPQEYEAAVHRGYQYFKTARSMLDITDCRNLPALQAVVFMMMFLQSSARLSTCYCYIGIALRASCRLGMHRNVRHDFDLIEQEERKRIFWLIRKMDAYISALLGLPQLLNEDDIDQELPLEIDDDFITAEKILSAPAGYFHLAVASNEQTKLMRILQKVVRYIYPVTQGQAGSSKTYSISQSRIREIETDLQVWMDALPVELRPSENASVELTRVQQQLRFSYAHLQMMMYRPFLHFASPRCETNKTDRRSYACAAAGVSVARNVVHIAAEMKRRHLLTGSHWFVVYTCYLAILSLVYFVYENPVSQSAQDIMKDATEGKNILGSLAKQSLAADRCFLSLAALFAELPAKLKERRNSSKGLPPSRKRPNPAQEKMGSTKGHQSLPNVSIQSQSAARQKHRIGSLSTGDVVPRRRNKDARPDSSDPGRGSEEAPIIRSIESWLPSSPSANNTGSDDCTSPQPNQYAAFTNQTTSNQALGANLPDLRALMYPSTNPFEYGNQPLSTLEEHQVMKTEHLGMLPEPGGYQPSPPDTGFEGYNLENFNRPDIMPVHRSEAWQGNAEPTSAPFQTTQGNMTLDINSMGNTEAFWQQLARGQTGLTPGVGLDDIFGTDNWNPLYMGQGPQDPGL